MQIKEELNSNSRRRTSELQIDRFAEAMEEFISEAEPIVNDLKAMTKDIDEKLKELILYYGEDPNTIKSEEFFDTISSFSNSFEVLRIKVVNKEMTHTDYFFQMLFRKHKMKFMKQEIEHSKDSVNKKCNSK